MTRFFSVESIELIIKALKDESCDNNKCTTTDLDLACDMLKEYAESKKEKYDDVKDVNSEEIFKLKKCPFCNGKAMTYKDRRIERMTGCWSCGLTLEGENSVEEWNTRKG